MNNATASAKPSDAAFAEWLKAGVVKSFEERASRQTMLERIKLAVDSMDWGTIIGESVEIAWRRILKRREKRKVIILLTDGQGSDGPNEKRVARLVEQSSVELIAVGIDDTHVAKTYSNYVIYSDPQQLLSDFYPKLRDILRG